MAIPSENSPLSDFNFASNIINAAVNGIVVIDKHSIIHVWNDWMGKTSGLDANKVIGESLFTLYPELKDKRLARATRDAITTGNSTLISQALNRFPLPLKNPHSGEPIKQMMYVHPIENDSGERYGLIQIHDVSAAVKREHQLRLATLEANNAKEKAERLSNIKSSFISTVSHELRTPLTSVLGSLGLITGGSLGVLPQQVETLVTIAHKNTQRLLLLINDILDIEKIESGRMEFHIKPLFVFELVQQAIEANSSYASRYGVNFVITKADNQLQVNGDFERLMQVMNNLMSNAAKFSPEGSNIEISYQQKHHMVEISVRDFGAGIAEEFQPTIFEKFTQADMSDSRAKGGTGLGLNIAKTIIEKHKGTINFETTSQGTRFFFQLPIISSGAS